jgi:voltage-gated potassium channel
MMWFRKAFIKTKDLSTRFILLSITLLVVFSSYFIHFLEPEMFKTMFDGFWWTMTTIATVGYGDLYPKTIIGRLWGITVFCIGVGLFTLTVSHLFEYLNQIKQNMERGKMDYKGQDQIIIIGWSAKANMTIKNILKSKHECHVVLIDEKLEASPFPDKHDFFFIKGNPSRDKVLERANITKASKILIFAEDKLKLDSPYDADARTAFIVTSIERMAPNIDTTVEIVLEENLKNFSKIDSQAKFKVSDEAFAKEMYN